MSHAEEAEDFQAVGIRCREARLAAVSERSGAPWLGEVVEPPQGGRLQAMGVLPHGPRCRREGSGRICAISRNGRGT